MPAKTAVMDTVDERRLLAALRAVRKGDFSARLPLDRTGLAGEVAEAFNDVFDLNERLVQELDRISTVVGREGRIGQRAALGEVAGGWRRSVDSVNLLIADLTQPYAEVSRVLEAVARGDLSQRVAVEIDGRSLEGEFRRSSTVVNTMVDQLNAFASEVTRVAREVGTEGKLGGQAEVEGVAGTWKDLTDSVNSMASNLTGQVRNIAEVTTAVANGDLSRKITADARGEILQLKDTINTMVDQLNAFASEVTRVAREVGTDGKLGGQADVRGVAGTWKDLTDSVNLMAGNLTGQVRNIAEVTTAVATGDLSKKITADVRGEMLELKDTINTMVDQLNAFASEVSRVAREVGTEGRLGGQAFVPGVSGTWKDLTDNVNAMASNLTDQVRNIANVTTAVANGDLSRKITVTVRGELLELKDTINTMVDQLNAFASEVSRVAREVGSEGNLGGQAQVRGVSGTWKDLTDNVNMMAANLTDQVRGIAKVVTAVANGNLKQRLTFEAKGEIAELADTINAMTDTLATFADQVTTVAREVGGEGKLGGQASVPGAAGTWRDLTDNVNQLAATLTVQLRAIGEVATAVTKGDLTRSVQVEARGEVEQLRDNLNEMIGNLRDTTAQNQDQDWLKTNLARFTGMLQGQKDLQTVGRLIMSELAPLVNAQHGVFYLNDPNPNGEPLLKLLASYAYRERKHLAREFRAGEGLVGQVVYEKERILLTNVPGDYVEIGSGLGSAPPLNIVVLPVLFEGEILAVVELASFTRFTEVNLSFLDQLTESIGIVLNSIAATARTEELLEQSQALAGELQTQQEELQQTNEELEEKARLLSEQNREVERRRREVEEARVALEQKAEQLAQTSRYKSQFLANMSHELRTPLNSLLILSQQLADNRENTLTPKQIEFATTIRSAGEDLLTLINDILDLSKIESGTTTLDVSPVPFAELRDSIDRTFRELAQQKGLDFRIELEPSLPPALVTDGTRLQQVLKNLLSNAFKFTDSGEVVLRVAQASRGWSPDHGSLNRATAVVAFAVADTGIGIPADKQASIFEAFQQADMTTGRRFGGTGLGLSISREIATLLGGELRLASIPGRGSTFTLYLPLAYEGPTNGARGEELVLPAGGRSSGPGGRGGDRRPVYAPVDGGGGANGGTAVEAPAGPAVESPASEVSGDASPQPSATAAPPALDDQLGDNEIGDDRATIGPEDRVLLIVEDDVRSAKVLLDMARARGFKGLVAHRGGPGLALARRFAPDAITLDIQLRDMDGLAVLDLLKHDPSTRHIPVHVISVEQERQRALELGAIAHLQKPVTKATLTRAFNELVGFVDRGVRNLLVVEDDDRQRQAIVELIGNGDVQTTAVRTGAEALEALQAKKVDCVVLDLGLPDMSGFELIEKIAAEAGQPGVPIIVYTGKELTRKEETCLRKLAETIIVKDARSPERLLDETALFLHRVEADLPEPKRRMLQELHQADTGLQGKRVLIVDDDMRNIFALTSALERYGMDVSYAESGRDAIDLLNGTPETDVVLMDIMMPEMDGYETIRRIRALPAFKALPIIAVTAKAMKGDREKCIEVGASDYVTKPVDVEQLVSLLRVWVYR